ncbi:MAG: cytochrome C oxidase subunit IV family protein [Arcobacter sp.]|uniref:cytochrome C oxidase subunit IV family protein n=1 Tax=Arcobacter sp. TaxID=1872629 RepID=UPI003D033274
MKLKTIWIFLVFLTTLTFILGKIEFSSYIFISLLLLTTFIKGQLVIDFFMDLKYVSSKYRLIVILWLFTVIVLIGLIFFI